MFISLIATALGYSPACEYVTLFRDAQTGAAKFHVLHQESVEGDKKTTQFSVGDKKAWLVEDLTSGNLTFVVGEEAYAAPKAKDKEPVTSLSYVAKVYANAAAPKPKKKGLLGGLGGNLLGGVAGALTGGLLSSAFSSSLGAMSSQVVASTALTTLQGFAVREMTQSLGRATSYTAMTDGENPTVVSELTKVDKTTMVETVLLRKNVSGPEVPKAPTPKTVAASELFELFSKYLLPSEAS